MKKILVISGKGGTGKTVLTASFAAIAKKKIMVDCDVDAANLYLLLNPRIRKTEAFMGGNEAEINQERCIKCGKCISICRFEAIRAVYKPGNGGIESIVIDPLSCEGCGACVYGCPVGAIDLEEKESGKWFISDTSYGTFVFAKLGIAAENSGRLVSKIKEEADKLGKKEKADYIIIDGPPGIGCPVISSLSGVDIALVVTEPTLSGMSDMDRVIKVAEHFGIETKAVINKYDINTENSKKIEKICGEKGIEVAGRIPFSEKVPKSVVEGIPYVEFSKDEVSERINEIWEVISKGG
ncbi:MAG TPA: ATP-binding protein [bacterium]|nr:ATP-binding protein [bacterium]